MIERKTVLDQVEQNRAGFVGVRIAFLLVEDGVEIDSKWHRTIVPHDIDPAAQMQAVNDHLAVMDPPMPPVGQADIDFIVQCHTLMKQYVGLA